MNILRPVKVVYMPAYDGNVEGYVKDYSYSQGELDIEITTNVFESMQFDRDGGEDSFETFFKKRGGKLITGVMRFEPY